ncbi:hypothetical protein M758_2G208000 [Ceratodon purpureus]|nr:hypothetical protein M758_2G208000 [Ceratodon purpureus]
MHLPRLHWLAVKLGLVVGLSVSLCVCVAGKAEYTTAATECNHWDNLTCSRRENVFL